MRDNNTFKEEVVQALNNEQMRKALARFAKEYPVDRENAYRDQDFAAIRQDIAKIKDYAIEHMEKLAHDFETNAKEQGAIVYRARDGADAIQYITSLAKEKKVKNIVKSKSMTSEEIHLNRHLEEKNFTVTETDLGEWIIQMLGEKPSHMVLPAIHLSKEDVAKIFSAYMGRPVEPVIKDMVAIARKEMRQKFLAADMGITGANFLAADTGSIFTLSNEGNARMTASIPKIQVVLAGYEKLVPTLDECFRIINALPKSATGQPITSYVTMITGNPPYLDSYGEKEKELHIVLLNNGRLDLLKEPNFRQALRCIRCGSCLNVCPIYHLVGGDVFGHTYMGAIGSILTAFTSGLNKAQDMQSLCIACGRCKEVCPASIDLPALIMNLRGWLAEEGALTTTQNLLLRQFLTRPKRMKATLRIGETLQKPLLDVDGFYKKAPFAPGINQVIDLPGLKPSLTSTFADIPQYTEGRCQVAIFGGCLVNHIYPHIGEAMVKVLNRYDTRAAYPPKQGCCGAPAYYMGDIKSAQKLVKINIEAFEKGSHEFILTPCPTCTAFIKEHFAELMPEGTWRERAKKIQEKTGDFTSFICLLEKEMKLMKTKGLAEKITYHDSCHYKHTLGLSDKSRYLLGKIANTREMEEADSCCGFGGSYLMKHPEISNVLLKKKCRNILQSTADTVATDCPGCILQISGGLHKEGLPIKTKHTAELLAEYFE